VLGHTDAVAVGDLGHGDALVDGGLEVDVVGTDAGVMASLSWGPGDAFGRE